MLGGVAALIARLGMRREVALYCELNAPLMSRRINPLYVRTPEAAAERGDGVGTHAVSGPGNQARPDTRLFIGPS